MAKGEFRPGVRVVKHAGVRLRGRVVNRFPWRNSNDGTYKAPEASDVPVEWDDGTKGYVKPQWIVKESEYRAPA